MNKFIFFVFAICVNSLYAQEENYTKQQLKEYHDKEYEKYHKEGKVVYHYNLKIALKHALDYKSFSVINFTEKTSDLKIIAKFGNIEELTLNSVRIKEFPVEIVQLKKLKKITIINCPLLNHEHFFDLIKELSIEEIIIDSEQIEEIPAGVFVFKNLKRLEINNTNISSIPDEIENLENIESLILQYNRIDNISRKMERLQKLKNLNLRDNPVFGYLNFEEFYEIIKGNILLSELCLNNTCLRRFPYELGDLPNLKILQLASNRITEVTFSKGFDKLEKLDLLLTKVYSVPEKFKKITTLGLQDQ